MIPRLFTDLGLAVVFAALIAIAPTGLAQQPVPVQPQPSIGISVVGEGIVLAQPNIARITLGADVFDQ